MKITIARTGNPWMDWGLVAFYHLLELQDRYLQGLSLAPGQLEFEVADDAWAQLQAEVYHYLRDQANALILPAVEMKVLQLPYLVESGSGFYNPRYQVVLSEQERALAKERIKQPVARPQVSLRRNYIGLTRDWDKLTGELEQAVAGFFTFCREPVVEGREACHLCGSAIDKGSSWDMRQNKNPLFNQHHNYKVRGPANSVNVGKMCPICHFLNVVAALHYNIPYYVGDPNTHLILPQINDLTTLARVFTRTQTNLADLLAPDLLSYRSNIPELRHRQLFPALIALYFVLLHRYTPEKGEWEFVPLGEASWEKEEVRWVIIRYRKGQNVSFGQFNQVAVDNRLFALVRYLPYGAGKEGNILLGFLNRLQVGEGRLLDDLARGIVLSDWHQVAGALFRLLKEGRDGNIKVWGDAPEFFAAFVQYAVGEVDKMLAPELLEDVKVVGRSIGANFPEDIGLFTNLNNVHDVASFRRVLKEVFLKMHKVKVATGKGKTEDELFVPKEARVENILESITRDTVAEIRDTLLIYACLMALRALAEQKKDKRKEEQQ